ncbi:MAG: hypothetical protein Q7R40_06880 [Phaeospirillum sp.]|nr:hypothetical protein [Phaeospirillum sp.]
MDTVSLSGVSAVSSGSQSLQTTSAVGKAASSAVETEDTSDSTVFYSSPVISFDTTTGALVWKFRDSTTGNVLYQSPSRTTLLYERSQRLAEEQGGKADGQGQIGRNVSVYG